MENTPIKVYGELFPMLNNSRPSRGKKGELSEIPGGISMEFFYLFSYSYLAHEVKRIGAYISTTKRSRNDVLGWRIGSKYYKSRDYYKILRENNVKF